MLPKSIQNVIKKWHVVTTIISMSEFFYFDKKENRYKEQHGYLRWNTKILLMGGSFYPFFLAGYLIWKRYDTDGVEVETEKKVVFHVIGWVEVFSILAMILVGHLQNRHIPEQVFVFDNMFRYSDQIEEMMKQRSLQFDDAQLRKIRWGGTIIILLNVIISILPASLAMILTVKWEPSHVLIEDILEFDVAFNLDNAGLLLFATWAAISAVRVAQLSLMMGIGNIQLSDSCFSAMQPISAKPSLFREHNGRLRIRYRVQTKMWGDMDEIELIKHMRAQQILVCCTNQITASPLVSFHHLGCTIVLVGISFTFIREIDELTNVGPVVSFVAFMGLIAPILIQYEESRWIGNNGNLTEKFLKKCKNLTSRRSSLWKTVIGVARIRLETEYPYGHLDRHSFITFCHNCLDNLFALLSF